MHDCFKTFFISSSIHHFIVSSESLVRNEMHLGGPLFQGGGGPILKYAYIHTLFKIFLNHMLFRHDPPGGGRGSKWHSRNNDVEGFKKMLSPPFIIILFFFSLYVYVCMYVHSLRLKGAPPVVLFFFFLTRSEKKKKKKIFLGGTTFCMSPRPAPALFL